MKLAALTCATALMLVMSVRPAPTGDWEVNGRRCDLTVTADMDILTLNPKSLHNVKPGETLEGEGPGDTEMKIRLSAADDGIAKIERALKELKLCRKFWACTDKREQGKVKHCYWPRSLGAFP